MWDLRAFGEVCSVKPRAATTRGICGFLGKFTAQDRQATCVKELLEEAQAGQMNWMFIFIKFGKFGAIF